MKYLPTPKQPTNDFFDRCCRYSTPWVSAIAFLFASMPPAGLAVEYRAQQLADINPNGDAWPHAFRQLDDLLVFEAFDGESDLLFSTDGSSVSRIAFGSVNNPRPETLYTTHPNIPGFRPSLPFKDSVYFVADGADSRTLYKTDGQVATEVASGVSGVFDEDVYLPPVAWPTDDYLYFRRNVGGDSSLYRTDGDSIESAEISLANSTSTQFFTEFGGKAILLTTGPDGSTLYRSNADSQSEIASDRQIMAAGQPIEFQGQLFFQGHYGDGARLFRTDGTAITELDFNLGAHRADSPIVAGEKMFFKAVGDSGYEQLHYTDGTDVTLFDFSSQDQHSLRFITSMGNDLYMFEYAKRRIVRTDGEVVSEISVDLRLDVDNFQLSGIRHETLLLDLQVAELGVAGSVTRGLFLVSGDAATFVDINQGVGYSPQNVTVFGDDVFFTAAGANGIELFKLSGDEVVELDINPSGHSSPMYLSVIEDTLFFTATGPEGRELYSTDGDDITLIDINPDGDSSPRIYEILNGTPILVADGGHGRELFSLVSAVPEPSAIILLVTATALFAAGRKSQCAVHDGNRLRHVAERCFNGRELTDDAGSPGPSISFLSRRRFSILVESAHGKKTARSVLPAVIIDA